MTNKGLKLGEAVSSYFGAVPDHFKCAGGGLQGRVAVQWSGVERCNTLGRAATHIDWCYTSVLALHRRRVTGVQSGLYSLLTPVLALAGAGYLLAPGSTLAQVIG